VLRKALRPYRRAEAYLAVLNDDDHVSVIHSLTRLTQELRPTRPVLGKIAGFVGDTRPGSRTPSLVVLDDETALFDKARYPLVQFSEVTAYYMQQREEYFPVAAAMTRGHPQERVLRRAIPIPADLVCLFLDSPTFPRVIERLHQWMAETSVENLETCEDIIYMAATAMCAKSSRSITSVMSIAATKLIMSTPIKAFADRLWAKLDNPDSAQDEDSIEDDNSTDLPRVSQGVAGGAASFGQRSPKTGNGRETDDGDDSSTGS
jgi:hypothetical protein